LFLLQLDLYKYSQQDKIPGKKKKVSFSECPGRQRGATNRAIHKNVTFGKHCFKKASPVEIPSGKKKIIRDPQALLLLC